MNLKVNLDGDGFKEVEKENLDYLKAKRNEFIRLNLTTVGVITAAAFLTAYFRGHLKTYTTVSILLWNLGGIALTAILSFGAK